MFQRYIWAAGTGSPLLSVQMRDKAEPLKGFSNCYEADKIDVPHLYDFRLFASHGADWLERDITDRSTLKPDFIIMLSSLCFVA